MKIERKQYYGFSVLSISHITSFKALSMTGHFASVIQSHTARKVCSYPSLLIKIIKMDNQKRQLANKYESTTKKQKVIMLKVKCELQVNDVMKEIADYGNSAAQETGYATRRA